MQFRCATVRFKDGSTGAATALGRSAAWKCGCGEVRFGTTSIAVGPCGRHRCGREFAVVEVVDAGGEPVVEVQEV